MPTTQRIRPTRLPTQSRGGERRAEIVRGLLGVVATTVVAVGPPIGLVLLVGNPLPDGPPNRDWLTAEISSNTLLDILAVVLWLAWLHLVVCVVVELVCDRRGRGLPPPVLGGGIGSQALARRLVATVALLSAAVATELPAASASSVRAPDCSNPRDAVTPAPADGGGPGSQRRTRNADRVVKYYEVQPGSGRHYDTLWDIAERFLGSGLRYREIFELNHGVLQPDGRQLTDADLIQPGWLLQLPSDAAGDGVEIVGHRVSGGAEPEVEPPPRERSGDPGAAGPEVTDDESAVTRYDTVLPDRDGAWVPTFGVAGGLLAAGLLAGLRRRRLAGSRLFLRLRSAGGQPAGPHGWTHDEQESALRWESDPTSAELLSLGLRAWPPALYGGPVPQPTYCVLTGDGVSAVFDRAPATAPPPQWQTSDVGRVWTLRRDDYHRLRDAPPALVPFPGLVAFGRQTDDSLLLMDLEGFLGAVSIGGDLDVARGIAMSWAVELAVHAWADERRVWLVGFADPPAELAPRTIRVVDDVGPVLESLEPSADRQRGRCRQLGVDTVAAGRVADPDPKLWASDLVVCSGVPAPETLACLQEIAARPEHAASVVIVGDAPQAAVRLAAAPDGRLRSGPLGIDVAAQRLGVEAYRGLAGVFRAADRPTAEGAVEGFGRLTPPGSLDASASDAGGRRPVEIGILGPVVVAADGPVEQGRRDLLTELVIYVALRPEGVDAGALVAGLWPRGVSEEVVEATLAAAQAWLGAHRDGQPRLVMADGRWTVRRDDVRFDWDVFKARLSAVDQPGADEVAVLSQALDLVRGEPWSRLPARSYGWLAYDTVDDDARIAVVLAARRLAAACARRDDDRGARDAIVRGLRVAPAAEELWHDALRLAARLGSRGDVQAAADQMYAAIDKYGSPAGATAVTDALVGDLLPGYRPPGAA